MIKLKNFDFVIQKGEDSFIGYISSDIRTKQDLLKTLGENLSFPDYFGENWDAAEECIQDLTMDTK